MKKSVIIISIIIGTLLTIYYVARVLLTKHYTYTHQEKLEINISLTEIPGLGQAGGYDILFEFENKKTGKCVIFQDGNDRFWYEFYIQDITIENVKKKTIVIHDLDYGNYVFIDYKTLRQRSKHLFDFDGGTVLDSTSNIVKELANEPIWTVGCHWQELCDR